MTRYSTNGMSFFAITMKQLQKEKKARGWARAHAAALSYFNDRFSSKAAVSLVGVTTAITGLAVQTYA